MPHAEVRGSPRTLPVLGTLLACLEDQSDLLQRLLTMLEPMFLFRGSLGRDSIGLEARLEFLANLDSSSSAGQQAMGAFRMPELAAKPVPRAKTR